MKLENFNLNDASLVELTIDECDQTIGGSWYSGVEYLSKAVGAVVGGAAAALVRSVQYGLDHPAGINQGMENVH
ncbi:hypothetical protein [Mucilaginibacter kameinonensis]|uniref:hypothetical protein n=1 Tax=Mucilaginibacter kameinonensis TaxID=452286 RepID=UPI000EF75E9B|nr:hypothetical protein [Mucilaginibacter kameinonensis]